MNKTSGNLIKRFTTPLLILIGFSAAVNILLLIQPLYMLQIYDRVMSSGSVDTLLYISILAALALLLLAAIDAARSILAGRMAARFEVAVGEDVFRSVLRGPGASANDVQPLRDMQTVRNFMSGRALFAYLDLPFAPFFVALLYLIHPSLFWLTVLGVVILAALAFLNKLMTTKAAKDASSDSMRANLAAQSFSRSADSLWAMGMIGNATRAWGESESDALKKSDRLNGMNSVFSSVSRALRTALQVAIYGYGGYLVLEGQMTGGMIFAASLIAGRALQPIDQVIGGWKHAVEARKAWDRVVTAYEESAGKAVPTELPDPVGHLHIEQVVVFPPKAAPGAEPLLKRITAAFPAGQCIAVIGPSGAGKSTLVRTLIGAVEPKSGAVRVDGSDIRHWDRERLGRFFGYLAQEVELLPGTIAQNIARFSPDAKDEEIVLAARKAQVHGLIQKLPKGYDTMVGPGAMQLSGGQRQRVGLARAFFGSPRILILDEPNANLDGEGDLALDRAIRGAKEDKVTVLIVTQKRQITERSDAVLLLKDGAIDDFGSTADVFARQAEKVRQAQAAQRDGRNFKPPQKVIAGRFPAVVAGGAAQARKPAEEPGQAEADGQSDSATEATATTGDGTETNARGS